MKKKKKLSNQTLLLSIFITNCIIWLIIRSIPHTMGELIHKMYHEDPVKIEVTDQSGNLIKTNITLEWLLNLKVKKRIFVATSKTQNIIINLYNAKGHYIGAVEYNGSNAFYHVGIHYKIIKK